mmetsp:Transcript_714/g.1680  ORF Transcript_714/g.1680 Transcript_714/m.1680 type:complete len:467 (-) Transcript_714:309-1709(-)
MERRHCNLAPLALHQTVAVAADAPVAELRHVHHGHVPARLRLGQGDDLRPRRAVSLHEAHDARPRAVPAAREAAGEDDLPPDRPVRVRVPAAPGPVRARRRLRGRHGVRRRGSPAVPHDDDTLVLEVPEVLLGEPAVGAERQAVLEPRRVAVEERASVELAGIEAPRLLVPRVAPAHLADPAVPVPAAGLVVERRQDLPVAARPAPHGPRRVRQGSAVRADPPAGRAGGEAPAAPAPVLDDLEALARAEAQEDVPLLRVGEPRQVRRVVVPLLAGLPEHDSPGVRDVVEGRAAELAAHGRPGVVPCGIAGAAAHGPRHDVLGADEGVDLVPRRVLPRLARVRPDEDVPARPGHRRPVRAEGSARADPLAERAALPHGPPPRAGTRAPVGDVGVERAAPPLVAPVDVPSREVGGVDVPVPARRAPDLEVPPREGHDGRLGPAPRRLGARRADRAARVRVGLVRPAAA